MRQQGSVTAFQIYFLFITTIGILNHVIILPALLDAAERDAWVAILFTLPIILLLIYGIYFITQKTDQQPIIDWLKTKYGSWSTWPILLLLWTNLYLNLYIALKDTITWTNVTYLPNTPNLLLTIIVILLCYFTALHGIETITIVNGIILPFTLLFGFFVAIGNLPQKDFAILLPVFQQGVRPYYTGILYHLTGTVEMILLVFLQHHIKTRIRYLPALITGLVLTQLTLGPTIGALTEFGPVISSELRYPAYEQWRLLTITRIVEHVDFLSVYQWWTGAYMRISLALFLIVDLLPTQSKKIRGWAFILISISLLLVTRFPANDIQFWKITANYLLPYSLISLTIIFLILLLLVIINAIRKPKGDQNVLSQKAQKQQTIKN